jgi:hypothetical protein
MAEKPDAHSLAQSLRVPPSIEVRVFPDWFSQAGPAVRDYQHWIARPRTTCVVSEA